MAWTDVLKDGAPYGAYVAWCRSRNGEPTFERRIKIFDGTAAQAAECFDALRELLNARLKVGHQLTEGDVRTIRRLLDGKID